MIVHLCLLIVDDLILLFRLIVFLDVMGISCYKCQSRNGVDPSCESASSGANYQENCRFQPMGRTSQFSGEYCVKIIGKLGKNILKF